MFKFGLWARADIAPDQMRHYLWNCDQELHLATEIRQAIAEDLGFFPYADTAPVLATDYPFEQRDPLVVYRQQRGTAPRRYTNTVRRRNNDGRRR